MSSCAPMFVVDVEIVWSNVITMLFEYKEAPHTISTSSTDCSTVPYEANSSRTLCGNLGRPRTSRVARPKLALSEIVTTGMTTRCDTGPGILTSLRPLVDLSSPVILCLPCSGFVSTILIDCCYKSAVMVVRGVEYSVKSPWFMEVISIILHDLAFPTPTIVVVDEGITHSPVFAIAEKGPTTGALGLTFIERVPLLVDWTKVFLAGPGN